jgi:hypothetical protein
MLRRMTLVRIEVSQKRSASIITVTRIGELETTSRIGELGTTLTVTNYYCSIYSQRASVANVVPSSPILVTLMMEALRSSEMSVHIRATRRNISEDGILEK